MDTGLKIVLTLFSEIATLLEKKTKFYKMYPYTAIYFYIICTE